jgi:hypothetical protein
MVEAPILLAIGIRASTKTLPAPGAVQDVVMELTETLPSRQSVQEKSALCLLCAAAECSSQRSGHGWMLLASQGRVQFDATTRRC